MLRIHVRHTRAGIYRQSEAKINSLEARHRDKGKKTTRLPYLYNNYLFMKRERVRSRRMLRTVPQ